MLRTVTIAAGLLLTTAAPAAADPAITKPATLSSPGSGIATGPDGALWVSLPESPGKVARVTVDGTVTSYPVGSGDTKPTGMAVGADGALWYVERGGAQGVGRVSTGGVVSRFAGLTGLPTAIAAGPDGNLWVTEQGASFNGSSASAVARVTPSGTVTEFPAGDDDPFFITAGPDGALWFTTEETIGRITTSGDVTHFTPDVFDDHKPAGIAAGADELWFAADKAVGRISTAGVAADYPSRDDGFEEATAMVVGPDGAAWFTAEKEIGRVTPDGTVTTYRAGMSSGDAGDGIATGPDGAIWFTHEDPILGRITVPPFVGDVAASDVGAGSATVAASVRANALPATATVQVRDAAQTVVAEQVVQVAAGLAGVPVAFSVTGLAAAQPYTATVTATSGAGPAFAAAPASFTTGSPTTADPSPTPTATAAATPPVYQIKKPKKPKAKALPVAGEAVVLKAAAGEVRVKTRGQGGFTTLDSASAVPLGALIDTRKGEVRLQSALPDGTIQAGLFRAGLFRVRQDSDGFTNVILAGRLDCRTPRSALASASRSGKRKRKVWGSDDGGSFRTHGRDSVATVRGTKWLTVDRCAGTTTRVVEGAVSVRVKGKRRAKLVRAGERIFVPHR